MAAKHIAGFWWVVCFLAAPATSAQRPGVRERGEPESQLAGCKGTECEIVDAELICAPMPELPKLAKAAHIYGFVTLAAVVDERGYVRSLKLISGHVLLVTAAINAAKYFRFKPATMRGVPIQSAQTVAVRFWITPGGGQPAPSLEDPCALNAPPAKNRAGKSK